MSLKLSEILNQLEITFDLSDDPVIEKVSALDEAQRTLIRVSDLAVIRDPYVILGLVILAVFVLFLVSKMPQSKEEGAMPSLGDTFAELAKTIGPKWKALDSQVLAKYQKLAVQERNRYASECAAYRAQQAQDEKELLLKE